MLLKKNVKKIAKNNVFKKRGSTNVEQKMLVITFGGKKFKGKSFKCKVRSPPLPKLIVQRVLSNYKLPGIMVITTHCGLPYASQ